MKFLLLAAACLSVAVAGPTRGPLIPDSAGPIVIPGEEIATDPAIVPEDISVGPALVPEDIAADPAIVPEDISVGPALVPEDIAADPALVPEDISVGPALVEEAEKKSALVQVIININSKNHVIDIPAEEASIPEGINVGPALVEELPEPENINVDIPSLPLPPSPADIGNPELPGLDADNAQNIPDELN